MDILGHICPSVCRIGPISRYLFNEDGAKVGDEDIINPVKLVQELLQMAAKNFLGSQKRDRQDRVGIDRCRDTALHILQQAFSKCEYAGTASIPASGDG